MAELSFVKSGSKYVSEFKVSSDFNLHIERDKGGYLFLYQRSSESGEYDSVGDSNFAPKDLIIDYDCTALVYPKTIKIVSEVEPTFAAVTTSGEVTEIKSQSKEVEVTANGTMDITPDAGFSYLNSVKVKTNVAQSGGGSASSVEYINFNNVDTSVVSAIMAHSSKLKYFFSESGYLITQAVFVYAHPDAVGRVDPVAAAIDFSVKYIHNFTGAIVEQSAKEMLISEGVTEDQLASLPRITKEEFYNLNA